MRCRLACISTLKQRLGHLPVCWPGYFLLSTVRSGCTTVSTSVEMPDGKLAVNCRYNNLRVIFGLLLTFDFVNVIAAIIWRNFQVRSPWSFSYGSLVLACFHFPFVLVCIEVLLQKGQNSACLNQPVIVYRVFAGKPQTVAAVSLTCSLYCTVDMGFKVVRVQASRYRKCHPTQSSLVGRSETSLRYTHSLTK